MDSDRSNSIGELILSDSYSNIEGMRSRALELGLKSSSIISLDITPYLINIITSKKDTILQLASNLIDTDRCKIIQTYLKAILHFLTLNLGNVEEANTYGVEYFKSYMVSHSQYPDNVEEDRFIPFYNKLDITSIIYYTKEMIEDSFYLLEQVNNLLKKRYKTDIVSQDYVSNFNFGIISNFTIATAINKINTNPYRYVIHTDMEIDNELDSYIYNSESISKTANIINVNILEDIVVMSYLNIESYY